jgi:hypothetical protein
VFLPRRERPTRLAALLLASGVCVGLACARVAWTGRASYLFLVKNLLLGFFAWTGLAVGFASLYVVQRALGARWGAAVGSVSAG